MDDDEWLQQHFIERANNRQYLEDEVSERAVNAQVEKDNRLLNKAREKARVGLAYRYTVSWSEAEPVFHNKGRLTLIQMQDMMARLVRDVHVNEIWVKKNLYVNDELVDAQSFRRVLDRVSSQGTIAEQH